MPVFVLVNELHITLHHFSLFHGFHLSLLINKESYIVLSGPSNQIDLKQNFQNYHLHNMPLPINRYRLPDAPTISTSTVKKSRKFMILILTFVLGYVYISYYSSVVDEFEENAKDVQSESSMDSPIAGLEEQNKGGFDLTGHLDGHSDEEMNASGNEDKVTFNLDGTIDKDDLETSNSLVQQTEENESMGESDEEEEAAQENGDSVNEENMTENNQEGEEETAEESEIEGEEEVDISDGSSIEVKDEEVEVPEFIEEIQTSKDSSIDQEQENDDYKNNYVSQEQDDSSENQHNESDGDHEIESIIEEQKQNNDERDSNEEDFDASNEGANANEGDEIDLTGEDQELDQIDENGSNFEIEERDETFSDEEQTENSVNHDEDGDEDGEIDNSSNGIEESAEDNDVIVEDAADQTGNQTEIEREDNVQDLDKQVNEEEVDEENLNEAVEGSDEEEKAIEGEEDLSDIEEKGNDDNMEACTSNPFADTLDKTFADIVSTLSSSLQDTAYGQETAETIKEFSSSTVDKTFLLEVDEENEGSRRQNLRGRSRHLDEDSNASRFGEDETSAVNEEETSGTNSTSLDIVSVQCTTKPEFSILEGICGLESHMQISSTEGEEKAECNYMMTTTGSSESTSDEDDETGFIKKLLEESRCNIYITQLCSSDENSSLISLEQTDERLHHLENACIEPLHDSESVDSIVDVERRLENDNGFELPQIDLLYVNDKATVMDELVDSFLKSSKMTIKSPDNKIIANLPMQLVFNNVSKSDELKQNVYDKMLKSGYISIEASSISAEESKHLTLMRFYCPGSSPPLMQQFVGGGFPI